MTTFKLFTLIGFSTMFFVSHAIADQLDADGIVVNNYGVIQYRTQYEASGVDPATGKKVKPDICEAFGAHLPTARELAQESQRRGAAGISELAPSQQCEFPFYKVSVVNPDGANDEFCFSHEGYRSPVGYKLGSGFFWSSSTYLSNPDIGYVLGGKFGVVDLYHRQHSGGYHEYAKVLCFPGR